MPKLSKIFWLVVAVVTSGFAVSGETLRPVTSTYTLSAGSTHEADTYLSPLKYDGWGCSLDYERWQAMKFNPQQWVMRLALAVYLDKTQNPARNAAMWYGGLDASWSMMHRWKIRPDLTVGAGPATSLSLGCLYNDRNGNNPAAAKAVWMVGGEGYATYKCKIGQLPVTLGYHVELPLTGAFFSPEYGELYYEIYLGDRSGLAHWGWWGNYFALDNLLTADLHFGATALRLGFNLDYETTKVNNITTRRTRYMAVVGITGEWISLNPRKSLSHTNSIISAY